MFSVTFMQEFISQMQYILERLVIIALGSERQTHSTKCLYRLISELQNVLSFSMGLYPHPQDSQTNTVNRCYASSAKRVPAME